MTDVRKFAENLLKKHNVITPPINAENLAEAEGVNVRFLKFKDGAEDLVHGYYDHALSEIVVNRDDSPEEKLFTIAHELGHHLLHQEYSADADYVPRLKVHVDNKYEKEADEFAVQLLAPTRIVDMYSDLFEDADLRKMFLVTQKVLAKAKSN